MDNAGSKNIFETILAVMEEIGAIEKGRKSQQGFQYRGVDDIMKSLQPACIKHRLFISPEVMELNREEHASAKGGTLYYTICKVKYTFWAEDGSCIECVTCGESMDSGDKATSKAMSVAFKYACMQVFCIPAESGVGGDGGYYSENYVPRPDLVSPEQAQEIRDELNRTGIGRMNMMRGMNLPESLMIAELTREQYSAIIPVLRAKKDKPIPEVPDDTGLPWNTPKS